MGLRWNRLGRLRKGTLKHLVHAVFRRHRLESRAMNGEQALPAVNNKVPFSIPVRVYYEDTDAGGVVYYANYLKFFERCRTEWIRALGFGQSQLAAEQGVVFVVRSASANYLRPARLDDALRVDLQVTSLGRASLALHQQVWRLGGAAPELLVSGEVQIACVLADTFRPAPIPETLRPKLQENT